MTESLVDPFDLSDCPYYRGAGTCESGCWDEPHCVTYRPLEGWPSELHPLVEAPTESQT